MSSKKTNKNIFKRAMNNLINNAEKEKINESLKGVKSEWKNVKQELNSLAKGLGYQKENSNNINVETKSRKEILKENLPIIMFFEFIPYLIIIVGGISLFYNSHILLGMLILLLIPIVCSVIIICCLKYIVNSTFRNIFDFLKKEIKKTVGTDNFQIGVIFIFLICLILFLIMFDKKIGVLIIFLTYYILFIAIFVTYCHYALYKNIKQK